MCQIFIRSIKGSHPRYITTDFERCRRLLHCFAPSYGDPDVRQGEKFGHLGTERLTKVKSKFRLHDGSADPSFCNWFSSAIKDSRGKA